MKLACPLPHFSCVNLSVPAQMDMRKGQCYPVVDAEANNPYSRQIERVFLSTISGSSASHSFEAPVNGSGRPDVSS